MIATEAKELARIGRNARKFFQNDATKVGKYF
jgi:hypothetical protein